MTIQENVAEIRERIREAAEKAGKTEKDIVLVAATKMNDAERVRTAIQAGVDACGENRVQEMQQKLTEEAYAGAPLYFIGHLQKNKVRQVVGKVDMIQSVDSVALMEEINKRAEMLGICQEILMEVNIGREEAKSGFLEKELVAAMENAAKYKNLKVRGLMAIPPATETAEEARPYFAKMRQLFIDIDGKKYDNVSMDFLSMGMSHDYEAAILEGSNMVRVGTGIFGARNYGDLNK